MMNFKEDSVNKLKTYVGFAIKARKAVFGIDAILSLRKSPQVVLHDAEVGSDTQKKLGALAEAGVPVFGVEGLLELTHMKGVKVLGVRDDSLAGAIIKTIKEERE